MSNFRVLHFTTRKSSTLLSMRSTILLSIDLTRHFYACTLSHRTIYRCSFFMLTSETANSLQSYITRMESIVREALIESMVGVAFMLTMDSPIFLLFRCDYIAWGMRGLEVHRQCAAAVRWGFNCIEFRAPFIYCWRCGNPMAQSSCTVFAWYYFTLPNAVIKIEILAMFK